MLWAPACDIENFSLRLRQKFENTIERAKIGVRDLEEDNITIHRDELRQLLDRLLKRLGDETELRSNYYLNIPTDEWDQLKDSPKPSVGSLYDDWAELQKDLDEDRLFSTGHSVRLTPLKIPTLYST